jgi:16S rRNA (cytosine1402-N4)-methyltransferase
VVKKFLETKSDWLLMIDSDEVLTTEAFDKLIEAAHEKDRPIVAGLVFASFDTGEPYPMPLPTIFLDAPEGFLPLHKYDKDSVFQVDAAGTGCLLVHRSVLEAMRENADERFAVRISDAIIASRPISSTTQLAEVVVAAIPAPARRRGGHPAKRTFQAIRIEVNAELQILASALRDVIDLLQPGGRLAVLSYHSGEDRIVKEVMRSAESGNCTCPAGLPCACGAVRTVRRVRVARSASASEQARNSRSTSARLRVVEKIESGL